MRSSVRQENRFESLVRAPASARNEVAEGLYDQHYGNNRLHKATQFPAKRRIKRIALFRAIIGRGHEAILEMGCGFGDLTYALVDCAERVVGTDISSKAIELAVKRKELWPLLGEQIMKAEFKPMSAIHLEFSDGVFDWTVSTSMIEHLHPEDVETHLREVWRVLKPGGHYLFWCPNGLGHHGDRDQHLTMLSYAEWTDKLRAIGFRRFRTTLTSCPPVVDARWKIFTETVLSRLRIKILWSHLGVRNVLLVAMK
jgi:SAM-dependent methyltransferase